MTVEELNAVDMLNDISNTANQMIEKRYKTFANENLRETANNSLREIQLKADELRKEIIGRNDFYQALVLIVELKERILDAMREEVKRLNVEFEKLQENGKIY